MYCMPKSQGLRNQDRGLRRSRPAWAMCGPVKGGGEGEESKSHKVYFFLFFLLYIGNFPERQMSVGFF